MQARYCPHCGAPITVGVQFCAQCGKPAPQNEPVGQAQSQQPNAQQPSVAAAEMPLEQTVAMPETADAPGLAAAPAAPAPMPPTQAQPALGASLPSGSGEPPGRALARRKGGRAVKVTMLAGKALGMADAFNVLLSSPFPGWRAEAVAPMGPSTGGGKQAKQHLSLIAPHGGRLAIGSVDWSQSTATIRAHTIIAQMYRSRYGQPLPITPVDYAAFVDRVTLFLKGNSVTVEVDNRVPKNLSTRPPPPAAQPSSARVWIVVLLVALAVAIGLVLFLWLRK